MLRPADAWIHRTVVKVPNPQSTDCDGGAYSLFDALGKQDKVTTRVEHSDFAHSIERRTIGYDDLSSLNGLDGRVEVRNFDKERAPAGTELCAHIGVVCFDAFMTLVHHFHAIASKDDKSKRVAVRYFGFARETQFLPELRARFDSIDDEHRCDSGD